MTKDHYRVICEHFNLRQYSFAHEPNLWSVDTDAPFLACNGIVCFYGQTGYAIKDSHRNMLMFVNLPTKELAKEILQYIKDTEILFI